MASSNASAVEQQISRETVQKSENAHRRQVGYILTEISGFGKTISNCQNSNHIGRTEKKIPVLLICTDKKTYLVHDFTAAF